MCAAQCVTDQFNNDRQYDADDIQIILGTIDIHTKNQHKVGVEKIFIHPGFKTINLDKQLKNPLPINDVAMIRTKGNVLGLDNVVTMKAVVPFSNKTSYVGRDAWVIGYGNTNPNMSDLKIGVLNAIKVKSYLMMSVRKICQKCITTD